MSIIHKTTTNSPHFQSGNLVKRFALSENEQKDKGLISARLFVLTMIGFLTDPLSNYLSIPSKTHLPKCLSLLQVARMGFEVGANENSLAVQKQTNKHWTNEMRLARESLAIRECQSYFLFAGLF